MQPSGTRFRLSIWKKNHHQQSYIIRSQTLLSECCCCCYSHPLLGVALPCLTLCLPDWCFNTEPPVSLLPRRDPVTMRLVSRERTGLLTRAQFSSLTGSTLSGLGKSVELPCHHKSRKMSKFLSLLYSFRARVLWNVFPFETLLALL